MKNFVKFMMIFIIIIWFGTTIKVQAQDIPIKFLLMDTSIVKKINELEKICFVATDYYRKEWETPVFYEYTRLPASSASFNSFLILKIYFGKLKKLEIPILTFYYQTETRNYYAVDLQKTKNGYKIISIPQIKNLLDNALNLAKKQTKRKVFFCLNQTPAVPFMVSWGLFIFTRKKYKNKL